MTLRILIFIAVCSISCTPKESPNRSIAGLKDEVEIVRDDWGINHIYANNQHDLFFAQGYSAAKDRLFQFEIWRRQATGTVAEILGERELERDIGTRLFKFRGNMTEEMNYYHEDGEEIITAYVDGVNAYIDEAIQANQLPIEFQLLGIKPEKWTPGVVISRHQGLLGNISQELNTGRAVAKIGSEKVKKLAWFHPKEPNIELDPTITSELLEADILNLYNAFRRPVRFLPEDIVPGEFKKDMAGLGSAYLDMEEVMPFEDIISLGSNNWVISGDKTSSGHPIMANDPHRTIAVPSLRYMVHLVAPGWNVIGGGEPEIPGISIGHNDFGAWGLTVFLTDGEDLLVYDLNPDNLNEYRYSGTWEEMKVEEELIKIKGRDPVTVDLRYTRHGPVTFIDSVNFKAYAVRCAWLEPGGSPYLASLRMDQAKTWEEFKDACNYSHIPGENMIWADKEGNIGWQAVGIAPIRNNYSGLVPVPGDGRYEWDGYLPIVKKPNDLNPQKGFIATANQNVTPDSYEHWNAIGFSWSDPFRGDRVNQVLEAGSSHQMKEMMALQTDYKSLAAERLVAYLKALNLGETRRQAAREFLLNWDFKLEKESIAATIYVEWENQLKKAANALFVPETISENLSIQLSKLIEWIDRPEEMFGTTSFRDEFLADNFTKAMVILTDRLGEDMTKWQYGQADNKHILIRHALGNVVNDSLANILNLGPLPRGGNAYTPGSSGSNYNQSSGASFRVIIDLENWDQAVATNTPGQSGDPASPFYSNLFESWAKDEYFPLFFSREMIEKNASEQSKYVPINP